MNEFNEPKDEHLLLGPYLLGGLSGGEREVFESHLQDCAACQSDMQGASGIPALLGTLGLSDAQALWGRDLPLVGMHPEVGGASGPSQAQPEACDDLLHRLATKRRSKRMKFGALGLAAVAAALVAGVFVAPALRPGPAPDARYTVASKPGPQVDVGLTARAWGTELDFDGSRLPTTGTLSLWVVDRDGIADRAGSWQATQTGKTRLTGAVPTQLGDIAILQLRVADSKVLATVELPYDPDQHS